MIDAAYPDPVEQKELNRAPGPIRNWDGFKALPPLKARVDRTNPQHDLFTNDKINALTDHIVVTSYFLPSSVTAASIRKRSC